jgi:hypothetical protein
MWVVDLPRTPEPSHPANPKRVVGRLISMGNLIAGSTVFSGQENEERHLFSSQAAKSSRLVIPFNIQFSYTSIGWSDDRVNIVVSHRITF